MEHPPELPEEPRREAPGLRAPPPARCGGPGAGGPPLERCAAASGGASGRPGPGYRSAGRGELRRACWSWREPGPPRGGWGSRGKRRPWDGWRGTPAPTPHRSGRARAPQALASALARAEVDGAVLVWCSPLPWLRPVLLTPACVVVVSLGFQHPSAPDETCTCFWGRLRRSPGEARCAPVGARYRSIRLGRLAVSISRFCK